METYKLILQITCSGVFHRSETIVTVKSGDLHSVPKFNFAASFHSVDTASVLACAVRSVSAVARVCNIY